MQKICFSILLASLLAGCGGGSSSNNSNDSNGNNGVSTNTPTWQFGEFAAAANFKDRCEKVRSGLDINGNAFPDKAGSELEEKLWLRSWSNDTYLWYDEIDDVNPNNFASAQIYFEQALLTKQTTPSGEAKDNFHFSQSTEEYQSFSQSGTQTGYGINWVFIDSAPPRDIRVTGVIANTPAAAAGITRGDKLIKINNENVISSDNVNFLNAALSPSDENRQYDFTFERADGNEVTYSLTSGVYAESFVNNIKVLDTNFGKAGYLKFDGFQRPAQTPLIQAFERFESENVTDLILDLRYNGGGLLSMSSQLAYMIAGPGQTTGKTFEALQFNDKNPSTNAVTGESLSPTPFYNREIDFSNNVFTNNILPSLNLTKVYVITTGSSCSASEALMNSLRGIDVDVIQIGQTTCGKPYGFYPTDNCGTTYFTIQFQGINDKGFGDYAQGFKPRTSPQFADELPGCKVADDFSKQPGDNTEDMLVTALARLNTGTCPANINGGLAQRRSASSDIIKANELSLFDPRYQSILRQNSIIVPIADADADANDE